MAKVQAPLAAIDSRNLFYALIHVSEQPAALEAAYAFVQQQLAAVVVPAPAPHLNPYHPAVFEGAFDAAPVDLTAPDYCRMLSPVMFTELAWLDNIVQACNNQSPLAADLFALYWQLQEPLQGRLLTAGPSPDMHTWAFAQQSAIPDTAFDFAALQLALGQFPRDFFAEILGFTYAYCQAANLPCKQAALPALLNSLRSYLAAAGAEQQGALWQRVQSGYWLYRQQLERCIQQVQAGFGNPLPTQQAVMALLERLRPAAIGHHGPIKLNGQPIDVWFAQSPFDAEGFLQALRQSAYIDPENPANSRLLKLFEFGGPMFGVLNASEWALLKHWVCDGHDPIKNGADGKVGSTFLPTPTCAQWAKKPAHPIKLSNREWYYTLVNIDRFPTALSAAKQRVQKLLRLTRLFSRLPFRHYTHQAFSAHIAAVYQHQANQYQPLTDPPKIPQQAYLWGIEQLAPAILTDGCWLQNIQSLKYHPNHAVGAVLSKIYGDELGSGILAQNHPYLYRQLLDSVGLCLPPIHTRAFSQHPGFMNSAFDIPNYLLAISKFPSAFLPELLGLNMAIELSGLGKDYLRLAQALKFHGLDPTIVNVHISIDNLATGHAALAQQAIQLYLDDILVCSGGQVMQQHWQRIYTGYCSLAWASRRFTFALVGKGLLKYGPKLLLGQFKTPVTTP